MISGHFGKILTEEADAAGIDPLLAIAIAETESAGDPWAIRFEPLWSLYLNPENFSKLLNISEETEKTLQACSWGLMQVMGTVARECGFDGNLLRLTDPRLGVRYGCIKLARLLRTYRITDDAIAAYNAGSPRKKSGKYVNQSYVDKVRRFYGPGKANRS